jgi:outer membrane lipoprotein-sorting protein
MQDRAICRNPAAFIMTALVLLVLCSGCTAKDAAQNAPSPDRITQAATPAGAPDSGTTPGTSREALTVWTKEPGVRIADGVSPATISKGNEYFMYYPGPGGILAARSSDGLAFEPAGTAIQEDGPGTRQQMVSNPAVVQLKDGTYRMIYEGQDASRDRRLFSAVSKDGMTWTKEPGIRFADRGDGPGLFTSVPEIIRLENGDLRMYYTRGLTSATALSADEGLTWTKERNLDLGRIVLDPDVVVPDDGTYILFFTTFDREFGVGPQYMMSARSRDGLNFSLDSGRRLEPSSQNGLVVDPDVVPLGNGKYRMYYGETSGEEMRFRILSAVSGG